MCAKTDIAYINYTIQKRLQVESLDTTTSKVIRYIIITQSLLRKSRHKSSKQHTHNITYASLVQRQVGSTQHDQSKAFSLPFPRETCEPEQIRRGMRHNVSVSSIKP
jgi:hypothetical protein